MSSQFVKRPLPTTPIRAGVPALRSLAPPKRGESASTGMLTICPQHILTLPETHSPNEFLDADSPLHHPARNACCLMAAPALVLAAQTRHTSARRTHASSDRFAHKTTTVINYTHCRSPHDISLVTIDTQCRIPTRHRHPLSQFQN